MSLTSEDTVWARACLVPPGLCLGACRSFKGRVRPKREITEMHALGQAHDALPGRVSRVTSNASPDVAVELAIHEVRPGRNERVLVAVHGIVSDHRTWRYIAGSLGDEMDVTSRGGEACKRL